MAKYFSNEKSGISLTVNIGQLEHGSVLKDHVVFITGGAGGIGSAIARKCIAPGAKVILAAVDAQKLALVEKELGENCRSICCDLTDISGFDKALEEATTYFGLIDCLINNAGVSLHEGDFMNVTEKTWDIQLAINLKAPYFLTQAWLRYYRKNEMKSGRIVMMASDTSGMGSSIPYGLAKAGVASLTHGLAKKLITEGIRINAMAPGTTLTPMTDDFTHGEVCRESTQGKRALFPEEIAELCVFLLSDQSVFGCSEANICFDNVQRELETNP